MTKNQVITQEAARAAGQAIKHVSQGLQGLAEREAMEGAMAVTFERVALLQEVSRILDQPEVEGMILFAAKAGEFEYVDTLNDAQILAGAKRAICKGYLLSAKEGAHFSLFKSGGKCTVMPKEAGYRYQLAQAGCTDIRVTAVTCGTRQSPNAPGKQELLVYGEASCVFSGKPVVVKRPKDMPYGLPCHEAGGPDSYEAKGRRRLLKDLWAAVSGEFAADLDDVVEAPQPVVIDSTATRLPDNNISPQALYDGTRSELVAYATGIQDEGMRLAFQSILDCIAEAEDVAALRARWQPEILPVLQQLQVAAKIRKSVEKLCQQRAAVLEAS
jgi:hypothetical protein